MNRKKIITTTIALLLAPITAWADLPLTVEDIITQQGKVKISSTITYANSETNGISAAAPVTIQTGETSFVTLPTEISERATNSDTLIGTLGVHYGLTSKTEIYSRINYLQHDSRSIDAQGTYHQQNHRISDAWAGLNYQIKDDNETPALLGFAEIALYEKPARKSHSFKTSTFGLTTYHAIDPVVLSLTAGYKWAQERTENNNQYQPSNFLFINPSIAFAVNDRITLSGGVNWNHSSAPRKNKQPTDISRTSTGLDLGVSYSNSKTHTLNFNIKPNVSGHSGTDLSLNWQYKL